MRTIFSLVVMAFFPLSVRKYILQYNVIATAWRSIKWKLFFFSFFFKKIPISVSDKIEIIWLHEPTSEQVSLGQRW